jgi:hypothetical protein
MTNAEKQAFSRAKQMQECCLLYGFCVTVLLVGDKIAFWLHKRPVRAKSLCACYVGFGFWIKTLWGPVRGRAGASKASKVLAGSPVAPCLIRYQSTLASTAHLQKPLLILTDKRKNPRSWRFRVLDWWSTSEGFTNEQYFTPKNCRRWHATRWFAKTRVCYAD